MSSECLFNKLVKFHKMNVQIHSYRYCRVWNKKELGQMGLLKTPIVMLIVDVFVEILISALSASSVGVTCRNKAREGWSRFHKAENRNCVFPKTRLMPY